MNAQDARFTPQSRLPVYYFWRPFAFGAVVGILPLGIVCWLTGLLRLDGISDVSWIAGLLGFLGTAISAVDVKRLTGLQQRIRELGRITSNAMEPFRGLEVPTAKIIVGEGDYYVGELAKIGTAVSRERRVFFCLAVLGPPVSLAAFGNVEWARWVAVLLAGAILGATGWSAIQNEESISSIDEALEDLRADAEKMPRA